MKRLIPLLFLLLFLAPHSSAQVIPNTITVYGSGAPVGSCFAYFFYEDTGGNNVYTCISGSWVKVNGGGGGGCIPSGSNYYLLYDNGSGGCADIGGLGTTTTLLHGNVAGTPTFGAVVSADLNITGTTCSNKTVTAISSAAAGSCNTITSSYVDNSIALTGTDINTSNQVTATHIASSTNTDLVTFNSTGNLVNYGGVTCTNQVLASLSAAGAGGCHTIVSGDTSGTFPATAHNLLSATHGDTVAASPVRGDFIYANSTPAWTKLALAAANLYPKSNGTDLVYSTLAASGVGSPTGCTNQFVTAFTLSADAAPTSTCTTDTLASAQHANQGTTTTVLHGNAAGNPAFGSVVSADMNITTTTCTNQYLTAISATGTGTCTTIPVGDLPTITIAKGGTNTTSAPSAGAIPNTSSTTASTWTVTPTLGLNGTAGTFSFYPGTGNFKTTLSAASTLAGATNFALPPTNGSNTNVLITDGSGNTSWSAAGSGTVTGSGTQYYMAEWSSASALTGIQCLAGQVLQGSATNPTCTATPALGASGTLGSVTMGNATNGTLVVEPATGALGSTTVYIPAAVNSPASLPQIICSGTIALPTTSMATGTKYGASASTPLQTTCTNLLTTDTIGPLTFNGDPTGTTGYAPTANGMLTIIVYPEAGKIDLYLLNNTGGTIVPGAATVNYKVIR